MEDEKIFTLSDTDLYENAQTDLERDSLEHIEDYVNFILNRHRNGYRFSLIEYDPFCAEEDNKLNRYSLTIELSKD